MKEEEFVNLIEEVYTDDSLKDVAKRAGPECVKKANRRAQGKQQNALSERKNSNIEFFTLPLCTPNVRTSAFKDNMINLNKLVLM